MELNKKANQPIRMTEKRIEGLMQVNQYLAENPEIAKKNREIGEGYRKILSVQTCKYEMAVGQCGALIVEDQYSYSGFRHQHDADWMHWATPVAYGPQGQDSGEPTMAKVFKLCRICGETGPGNKAHILFGGHRFVTRLAPR